MSLLHCPRPLPSRAPDTRTTTPCSSISTRTRRSSATPSGATWTCSSGARPSGASVFRERLQVWNCVVFEGVSSFCYSAEVHKFCSSAGLITITKCLTEKKAITEASDCLLKAIEVSRLNGDRRTRIYYCIFRITPSPRRCLGVSASLCSTRSLAFSAPPSCFVQRPSWTMSSERGNSLRQTEMEDLILANL